MLFSDCGVPEYTAATAGKLLPDAADAEHTFQAARNGVDFFVTVDRRTILRHKAGVEAVCQLQLATPASFENDALGGCNGDG